MSDRIRDRKKEKASQFILALIGKPIPAGFYALPAVVTQTELTGEWHHFSLGLNVWLKRKDEEPEKIHALFYCMGGGNQPRIFAYSERLKRSVTLFGMEELVAMMNEMECIVY